MCMAWHIDILPLLEKPDLCLNCAYMYLQLVHNEQQNDNFHVLNAKFIKVLDICLHVLVTVLYLINDIVLTMTIVEIWTCKAKKN